MSVSAFNRRWAAVILEALTRHGVRHICIAPGSRSTPLTDYVIFGGNVLMSQGSRVGAWAMIQTGCRFRKDIPPFIVAAQEPTTYYGVNSFIMSHEGFSEKVIKHISHAYRIIFQGNSSLTDALLMIKDQVPMSKEIQHIIDFVGESKLGILK